MLGFVAWTSVTLCNDYNTVHCVWLKIVNLVILLNNILSNLNVIHQYSVALYLGVV